MTNDAVENVKRLMLDELEPVTPFQAAVEVIKLENKIRSEAWDDDNLRKQFFVTLNRTLFGLHQCHHEINGTSALSKDRQTKVLSELLKYKRKILAAPPEQKEKLEREASMVSMRLGGNKFAKFKSRARQEAACRKATDLRILDHLNYLKTQHDLPESLVQYFELADLEVQTQTSTAHHPFMKARVAGIYSPSNGPKTFYELMLCIQAYLITNQVNWSEITGKTDPKSLLNLLMIEVAGLIERNYLDFPQAMLLEMQKNDLQPLLKFLNEHKRGVGKDKIIGYLRHFAAHNRNKMDAAVINEIDNTAKGLYVILMYDFLEESGGILGLDQELQKESMHKSLEAMDEFWHPYQKPEPEQLFVEFKEHARQTFPPKKANRLIEDFKKVRGKKPDNMEEDVILYAPEFLPIRKLRTRIFKSAFTPDGKNGPRTEFITNLAKNHRSFLLQMGLSRGDIRSMKKYGRLPSDTDLSVEHIVDREIGGTNGLRNFILMPSRLNALKDKLKQKQINIYRKHKKDFWMITWVPKRDEKGNFPEILSP